MCKNGMLEVLLLEGRRSITDILTLSKFWRSRQNNENIWPSNLNIEPTNICNANCIFCAYQYPERSRLINEIFFEKLWPLQKNVWVNKSHLTIKSLIERYLRGHFNCNQPGFAQRSWAPAQRGLSW